jgi:hypothetical protein
LLALALLLGGARTLLLATWLRRFG